MQTRTWRRGSLIALAASLVLMPSVAVAQTGDVINNHNSFNSDLATNQCLAADVITLSEGGPPPNKINYFVTVNAPYNNCRMRSRMVYVKSWEGIKYTTPYTYATKASGPMVYAVGNAFRCYTEVGLRRNDGSWFVVNQITSSSQRPPGCGISQ